MYLLEMLLLLLVAFYLSISGSRSRSLAQHKVQTVDTWNKYAMLRCKHSHQAFKRWAQGP